MDNETKECIEHFQKDMAHQFHIMVEHVIDDSVELPGFDSPSKISHALKHQRKLVEKFGSSS